MRNLTRGLVLAALVTCGSEVARGQGYSYLETFDSDTDTYTPPTTYGSGGGFLPGGSPPPGWVDDRNGFTSPPPPPTQAYRLIEEVPSGFNGVSTGPQGGANMAAVYGGASLHLAEPVNSPHPLGSFSYQIDFTTDRTNAGTTRGRAILMEVDSFFNGADGAVQVQYTDFELFSTKDAVTGQVTNNLLYANPKSQALFLLTTLPDAPDWYTFEAFYQPSSTLDPASGQPLLSEVINVYTQARFENGFRRGDLIASVQTDFSYVAPATFMPAQFAFATNKTAGQLHYIDNVALGPPINTPEPTCAVVFFGASLAAMSMRSARRRYRISQNQ